MQAFFIYLILACGSPGGCPIAVQPPCVVIRAKSALLLNPKKELRPQCCAINNKEKEHRAKQNLE